MLVEYVVHKLLSLQTMESCTSVKRTLNVITKRCVVISVANKFVLNAMNLMTYYEYLKLIENAWHCKICATGTLAICKT